MHHELLWSTNVGKQKAEKKCSSFMWGYYYCTVMMVISDIDGKGLIGFIIYVFRYFTLNVTVPSAIWVLCLMVLSLFRLRSFKLN